MLDPATAPDLAEFLTLGVSLMAATRDRRMTVELTRCAAARIQSDGRIVVAVPVPEGQRTLDNVERTGIFALSAALPTSYRTLQLKGRDAVRTDWPEKDLASSEHRARFVQALMEIGWPGHYASAFWSLECQAVVFTASEIFDQTPGPDAGRLLSS